MVKDAVHEVTSAMYTPDRVVEFMGKVFDISHLAEEYVWMLCMDQSCKITGVFEISHGSATHALFSPREILQRALLANATQIVLVHCHPSGEIQPSDQDIIATAKLNKACNIVGIDLADHIIIGCTDNFYYYSFNLDNALDN